MGRLAPDGLPLNFPLTPRQWRWLAANQVGEYEEQIEGPADEGPGLADMEPPPLPEEEEMLF